MTNKPVFVATHPRACSTAFERVFMTSQDRLTSVHEPFGDAFYFGPERLGTRYENDEKAREESGFADSTFKSVFDDILSQQQPGKRILIKDIAHYLLPPRQKPTSIAPSLQKIKRGVGTAEERSQANGTGKAAGLPYETEAEPGNPTVVPADVLKQFHFAFLIRHPKHSIPSYWRCTIPPLSHITGFHDFMPEEAGYDELRRIFDYMKDTGIVGPELAGRDKVASNGVNGDHAASKVQICLVDADDLLNDPRDIMKKFCDSVGIEFEPEMLEWDTPEDHQFAKDKFEKWKGFHEDAINSTGLKAREHGKPATTPEQDFEEWTKKYGEEAAKVIRDTVEKCLPDYEYLKQFAIQA